MNFRRGENLIHRKDGTPGNPGVLRDGTAAKVVDTCADFIVPKMTTVQNISRIEPNLNLIRYVLQSIRNYIRSKNATTKQTKGRRCLSMVKTK